MNNPDDIQDFLRLFSRNDISRTEPTRLSEIRKLELLPLVFSFVPRVALSLSPIRGGFRRHIIEHLESIGVANPTDDLVMTIKHICEQLVLSSKELSGNVGLPTRRKYGVSDLRAQGLYAALEHEQYGRCAVCGVLLAEASSIELDHIIPFYIMGDLPDGRNWQLLCGPCNNGKRAYLSALQAAEAWNWISPEHVALASRNSVSLRTRFVTLATKGGCGIDSCGRGPRDTELAVVQAYSSALPIAGLLDVLCVIHAAAVSSPLFADLRDS